MGIIVYGFAGTGKTTFCGKYKNALDLEESRYRYLDLTNENVEDRKGLQTKINPDFPNNYFSAIKEAIKKYDYVFVSYNAIDYCKDQGLDYFLIFPNIHSKEEYLCRYLKRNNSKQFICNMSKQFARYILRESDDAYAEKILFLNKGEYIESVFKRIGLIEGETLLPYINETISVVIPIYNGEKFLHRMLDSLIAQTYKDLQVILVDDGSRDASREICERYCKDNKNFTYVWKENGGVSSARNLGLKFATGRYMSFLDCDDELENNYFEKLLFEMKKSRVDWAMCGINEVSDQKRQYGLDENMIMSSRSSDLFLNMFNNYWFPVLWNKMYRLCIIKNKNISFNEKLSYDEDTTFNYDYYFYARKISLIPEKLYTYFINTNSLTSKGIKNIFENSSKTIETRIKMPKILFGENKEAIYISAKKILKAVLQEATTLLNNGESMSKIIKQYKKRLKDKFVKQATEYITPLEGDFMEYFYYTKIFKQHNVNYFCSYISGGRYFYLLI